jgi:hypothetical protein
MSETEAIVRSTSGDNLELTATHAAQMPHLQENLIAWTRNKLATVKAAFEDAAAAMEAAAVAPFNSAPFERLVNEAGKRVNYYAKVLAALEAGFVLMPTIDADVFAVRTKRANPNSQLVKFYASSLNDVEAQSLAVGQGRYVSNRALITETTASHQEKDWKTNQEITKQVPAFRAAALDEEIDFPMSMAKPEIIEVTTRAMALKVFDELGISPARRSGDPVIFGRIIAPRNKRRISFLIAWHVPTLEI